MLCVYIREEGSRETAQASPQGDHYRAAEGLGKDIGTLSSSPGECVLHKHLSTSKKAVSVEHTGSFLSIENGRKIFAENQCKGNRFDTSTKQKSLELLEYTITLDIFP